MGTPLRSLLNGTPMVMIMDGYPLLLATHPPRWTSVELKKQSSCLRLETAYEPFSTFCLGHRLHDETWRAKSVLLPNCAFRSKPPQTLYMSIAEEVFDRPVWYRLGRRSVLFYLLCRNLQDAVRVKLSHW